MFESLDVGSRLPGFPLAQGLRAELSELQVQLIEAKLRRLDEALYAGKVAAQEQRHLQALHPTEAGWHVASAELDELRGQVQGSLAESHYLEHQARALLSSARNEQVATQKALLLQVRRMQALETMRLADMRELHALEKAQLAGMIS